MHKEEEEEQNVKVVVRRDEVDRKKKVLETRLEEVNQ